MKVRIHRGAHEIGGSCVELLAQGKRLVLDLGRPLDAGPDEVVPLPPVPGLADGGDPSLLGVVISHAHQDHYGLLPQVAPSVPVFIGAAASRMLGEAGFFTRAGATLRPAGFLRNGVQLQLGPFRVTPLLVDHSAFDAYALLVEADGGRLFYSGDFRAHGRKGALFERLVSNPPRDINVLLLEGTMVQQAGLPAREEATEADVERRCIERFEATAGMALVVYSAQNVDRLVTLYRAALQSERDFVMDLYTATMARATGQQSIPQPGPQWPRVRVFVPLSQLVKVKEAGEFERTQWVSSCRLFPEQLAGRRKALVMTFRGSMARDLERAGCLEGASVTWSLWSGYLDQDTATHRLCERHGLPLEQAHASGHAFIGDLRRLVEALRPGRVVPMHTAAPERFGELFPRVEQHGDGEWWGV